MQHYYQVVLSIRELNDVLLQYLDEVIIRKIEPRKTIYLKERFIVRNQHMKLLAIMFLPSTHQHFLKFSVC